VTLLEACKAGDQDAWRRLFGRYARAVYRWAVLLGLPPAEAEDAAQEVLVIAIRKIEQCQDEAGLKPWLFRITRHVVANARRKAWFRRGVLQDTAPEPAFEHRPPVNRESELSVRRCLSGLSTKHREVLVLSDVEGHTREEMAKILQIPPGTVASRLRLARRAFRNEWENEWNENQSRVPSPRSEP
jgi:RNA polymerase sigma-70 factor (ECF subfamily)